MKDVNILKNRGVNLEASLEYLGDMDLYNETLTEFLDLVDGKVADLTRFKDTHDMANYAISAHSLKSDARYLGFTTLGEIALSHEMAGKENREDFVVQNFDAFVDEVKKTIAVAREYLQSTEAAPVAQAPVAETPVVTQAPVTPVVQAEPVVPVAQPQVAPAVTETVLPSVLVVDDSEIIRNFVIKMCSDKYNIITAHDGGSAIEELEKENNIRCVLLDLNMPGINGFKVLEYLQTNNLFQHYPVSIITGADDKETINDAFKYPIVDMLNKPFNEAEAKRIIERTMSYGK